MDVDDAVGKKVDEIDGHLGEETCQDDVVAATHGFLHAFWLFVELLARDDGSGHSQTFCTHQRVGIGTAAHHDGDFHFGLILKITDDVFAISATSCYEDGKFDGCHIFTN